MYSYIIGELTEKDVDSIVLESGNIGYQIFMPVKIMEELPAVGNSVKIYTYLHVREDAMILYGFLSREEKRIFKMLLGVNGIGPKGALSVLSVLSPDELRFAILSDDTKTIAKAPGVGGKTAQRLILELRDKLSLDDVFADGEPVDGFGNGTEKSGAKEEAAAALVALGYQPSEAAKAVQKVAVSEDTDVETILKLALKQMSFL